MMQAAQRARPLLDLREPLRLAAAVLDVIALREQSSIASQIAFAQDIRSFWMGFDARIRTHAQRRSQSGIEVSVAERFLQGCECRLAGAVAGSDVIDLVSVMQGGGYFFDCGVLGHDQVKSAGDEVD